MTFYELESFLTLARLLHYGRAADELNMSPSALSRIVSRLEEETGTTLFDRSNRQVTLTDSGRLFASFASQSIERRDDLLQTFSGRSSAIAGTLHVYASVTACYAILPLFLRELAAKYPTIHLSVETGDPAGAVQAVREGRAALAVAAIPEEGLASMETIRIRQTPLIYAAASTGPYTEVTGSPQDIVSSVPLILPKTGLARKRFDKWIKSRNVHPTIAAETEGNEAILAIVQLGLGIGLVPRIVLENGPYKSGFVVHEAGNALGFYDVGFIRRSEISGTQTERNIERAVSDVLHSVNWSEAVQ